jgi:hypothetical protein
MDWRRLVLVLAVNLAVGVFFAAIAARQLGVVVRLDPLVIALLAGAGGVAAIAGGSLQFLPRPRPARQSRWDVALAVASILAGVVFLAFALRPDGLLLLAALVAVWGNLGLSVARGLFGRRRAVPIAPAPARRR